MTDESERSMTTQTIDGELSNAKRIDCGDHQVVVGRITNDRKKRFFDGEIIRTSRILEERDGIIITRNSVYRVAYAA